MYLAESNDNADMVNDDDGFKFIDDLSLLSFLCLAGLLTDYDIWQHIPSDIPVDEKYLPADLISAQSILESVSNWTDENMMKLNIDKCNYMVFSRSSEKFTTRLQIKGKILDRKSVSKLLGIWISEDLNWTKNCQEICKKAYFRLALITKLRYVGVRTEDLIEIYILFIRSITECCSVVFHSRLTVEQSQKLENIQKNLLENNPWRQFCKLRCSLGNVWIRNFV